MNAIYVHIPFCSCFCAYCNFYSVKNLKNQSNYIKALIHEIELEGDFFKNSEYKTYSLYYGGGTPSVLDISHLSLITKTIRDIFHINCFKEFTIEVNPDDITLVYAKELYNLGINRISMGVQSFNEERLRWMNRRHTAHEAIVAYEILRKVGFKNISLDLIFGYNPMSLKEWAENLDTLISLKPEHISAYQMSIERGTPLWKEYESGYYELLSQEECAKQYRLLQDKLSGAGYIQYEISNFALPKQISLNDDVIGTDTFASLHNSSYWNGTPYLGLGPGAHSFTGSKGVDISDKKLIRRWNKSNLTKYIDVFSNHLDSISVRGYERLTRRDVFNEYIMLGLRKVEGISWPIDMLTNAELDNFKNVVKRLISENNLKYSDGRLFIPHERLFVSDMIIRDLII